MSSIQSSTLAALLSSLSAGRGEPFSSLLDVAEWSGVTVGPGAESGVSVLGFIAEKVLMAFWRIS